MREQAEMIREQHNLGVVGDTTLPWQLALQSGDQKLYTLGAESRFYHPTYGVLTGRFVTFSSTRWQERVGSIAFQESDTAWVVENTAVAGAEWRPAGLAFVTDMPRAGKCGWVQSGGLSLVQAVISVDELIPGRPLALDPLTGYLTYGQGIGVGSLLENNQAVELLDESDLPFSPRRWEIPAGKLWLERTGPTPEVSTALVAAPLAATDSRLTALEARVDEEVIDYAPRLGEIDTTLAGLADGLTRESSLRAQVDAAFVRRIRGLEDRQANDFITIPAFQDLEVRVAVLESTGIGGGAVDLSSLYASVSNNTTDITELFSRTDALTMSLITPSGVTPGTYTLATIEVDERGRVISASSGSGGGGSGLTQAQVMARTLGC
jgi:hypothetical protein